MTARKPKPRPTKSDRILSRIAKRYADVMKRLASK